MAKAVAKSASRSLGLLISKCKINGGFQYETFTKLFDTLVWSVVEYGAPIWGTKEFSCIDSVKNRAMRFFMGVGKYTLNLSLYGDMGWRPGTIKQWSSVYRHWSRLTKMSNDRVNRKVFLWGNTIGNGKIKNWQFRVKSRFKDIDMNYICNTNYILSKGVIKYIENVSFDNYKQEWFNKISSNDGSKLRTYRKFKCVYGVEKYLCMNMSGNIKVQCQNSDAGLHRLKLKQEDMKI